MLESSFFLFLIVLFYGAGRAFLDLIRWKSNYCSFTLPSGLGLVVVTIAVTWSYKSGISLNSFFLITSVLVAIFLVWRRNIWYPDLLQSLCVRRFEMLAMAGFAMLLVLPGLLGGQQFVIFRGNHYDSFNYLEAAITYQKLSYAQVSHLSATEIVRQGLFKFGQDNLMYRPEITFLYGALSSFCPVAFLRLHYFLLLYFQFLAFCALRALALELLPLRPLLCLLVSAAIVGGFWGQNILDIDAWSQLACMPLILLSLLLLIRIVQLERHSVEPSSPSTFLILYALIWVGMFYLYPEAASFLLPVHAICWGISICFFKAHLNWPTLILSVLGSCILLLPVFDSNLAFMARQYKGSLAGYNWWTYFDAFFFGRSGMDPDVLTAVPDFLAGALGIYFVTPDPDISPALAIMVRLLILLGFAGLVLRLATSIRSLSIAWLLLMVSVFVSLLGVLAYCSLKQFWPAGKAFSFVAYLALLLLVASALRTSLRNRSWVNRVTFGAATLLLLLQLGLFFYRPLASLKPFGIQYDPPYPAINDASMKKRIDYADWSVLQHLQRSDKVCVRIADPWIQRFVRILLLSNSIDFCAYPVFEEPLSPAMAVSIEPCPESTVRLTTENSTQGPFAAHLALEYRAR